MKSLRLIAGKTARNRIAEHGLTPDLIKMVLGASGGPKWLVLFGLDKYIFGEWLKEATHSIDLVGSSIGAWRMANAAHPEPGKMIEAFIDLYFKFTASDAASPEILSKSSYDVLAKLHGKAEAKRIVSNPLRNLNIVTVRSRGVKKNSPRFKEAAGILASVAANAIDRSYLARFFERVVFYSGEGVACPEAWAGFGRKDVKLTEKILADALLASGSIPFVTGPVTNIEGAPAGVYRDGGVIDYHFDVPWHYDEGIVLYPHFYSHIIPGWFDKSRKSRQATGAVWDQLLMLCPSDEFVADLPGGCIPERRNFTEMTDQDRTAYWQVVIEKSEKLAEELSDCLAQPALLMDRLEAAPQ